MSAVAAAALLGSALVGCTPEQSVGEIDIDSYSAVTAKLDYTTGEISTPLDAYVPKPNDFARLDQAYTIRVGRCMSDRGLPFPPSEIDWAKAMPAEDRRFGVWLVDRAAQYGHDLPPFDYRAMIKGTVSDMPSSDPTWEEALERCGDDVTNSLPGSALSDLANGDTTGNWIRSQALSLVERDPAWTESRGAWWACLEGQGLTPRTGDGEWGATNAGGIGTESDIRVAVIEAQCNVEVGMVQTLGDLLARYEAALIESREAVLVEEQSRLREIRADIDAAIAGE